MVTGTHAASRDLERKKKTFHTAVIVEATKNGTDVDTDRTRQRATLYTAVVKR